MKKVGIVHKNVIGMFYALNYKTINLCWDKIFKNGQ